MKRALDFFAQAAKAFIGGIVTVTALPIVQAIIAQSPVEWTVSHLIGGVIVGASVYAIPNKQTANNQE